jgi:anti-sigma regulatory factor (Ser/Thr protein kinase)
VDACLKLVVSSDPRLLRVVRGAVEQFALALALSESESCEVTLAVHEAVTNIIRHAYGDRHGQRVELTCCAQDNTLEFILADQGQPADPAQFCARPLGEAKPGGLGTHIIAQVMDVVDYQRLPQRNQLRLVKYLGKV